MANLPPCYDSDSEVKDQAGSVDHDSRQKLPWFPGTVLTGTACADRNRACDSKVLLDVVLSRTIVLC